MSTKPAHGRPPKRRTGLWLTIAIVVVLLAIVGGGVALYLHSPHGSTAAATGTPTIVPLDVVGTTPATGATNVVLVGAPSWSQDLSEWVSFEPTDPLSQLAAVWHAYPDSGVVGSAGASIPKLGTDAYTWGKNVLSAGVPLVLTETGDHNASGTVGAPFVSKVLPWADQAGASYLGWAWDVWQDADNVLIKDAAGTPTDGYGVYFQKHLLCVASGTTSCP